MRASGRGHEACHEVGYGLGRLGRLGQIYLSFSFPFSNLFSIIYLPFLTSSGAPMCIYMSSYHVYTLRGGPLWV
jgi:hypothetical protein